MTCVVKYLLSIYRSEEILEIEIDAAFGSTVLRFGQTLVFQVQVRCMRSEILSPRLYSAWSGERNIWNLESEDCVLQFSV